MLGVGATRVAAGDLTPGVLTAFLLYLGLFFAPVQQLSQVFDGYQQARIGLTPDRGAAAHPHLGAPGTDRRAGRRCRPGCAARCGCATSASATPGRTAGAGRGVAAGAPGETVALVGATGAGKSTLVKLLARFYDVGSGAVLVDGVDVRRYPLPEYRRRLGIVPQEPHLFTGDVAANIAYGRPDATPAQIEAAARAVGALELVRGLPGGFRHPVGERGQGLSAGQRQLIALARAELADPDLLLFDEATAALDPATEAAVLAAADQVTARRTAFVVAHRLATAARADRIVVLDGGRIVEQGSHEELLAAGRPVPGAVAGRRAQPGRLTRSRLSPRTGEDRRFLPGFRAGMLAFQRPIGALSLRCPPRPPRRSAHGSRRSPDPVHPAQPGRGGPGGGRGRGLLRRVGAGLRAPAARRAETPRADQRRHLRASSGPSCRRAGSRHLPLTARQLRRMVYG